MILFADEFVAAEVPIQMVRIVQSICDIQAPLIVVLGLTTALALSCSSKVWINKKHAVLCKNIALTLYAL